MGHIILNDSKKVQRGPWEGGSIRGMTVTFCG